MNASGTFIAHEVLAKHDEKYMPPEVVDALKRSGRWQGRWRMIGELGQVSLCFALALSLVLAGIGPDGRAGRQFRRAQARHQFRHGPSGFHGAWRFGVLTYAFVTSDFSVTLVANHSHTLKPLVYKISGVWGNHEGSMLLWVLVLALYAAMVAGLSAAANG